MRKKSVPQKLADKMQIPKDLAYQEPVLTMIGQRELCVENSMEFLFILQERGENHVPCLVPQMETAAF